MAFYATEMIRHHKNRYQRSLDSLRIEDFPDTGQASRPEPCLVGRATGFSASLHEWASTNYYRHPKYVAVLPDLKVTTREGFLLCALRDNVENSRS